MYLEHNLNILECKYSSASSLVKKYDLKLIFKLFSLYLCEI